MHAYTQACTRVHSRKYTRIRTYKRPCTRTNAQKNAAVVAIDAAAATAATTKACHTRQTFTSPQMLNATTGAVLLTHPTLGDLALDLLFFAIHVYFPHEKDERPGEYMQRGQVTE